MAGGRAALQGISGRVTPRRNTAQGDRFKGRNDTTNAVSSGGIFQKTAGCWPCHGGDGTQASVNPKNPPPALPEAALAQRTRIIVYQVAYPRSHCAFWKPSAASRTRQDAQALEEYGLRARFKLYEDISQHGDIANPPCLSVKVEGAM